MPDMTLAPRRRPLWRLFIMPVLLLIAAAAWSAFWFYAASQVDVTRRCLARAGGEIRPDLRLRQALGGGLSVPPRSPLRRRQRRAGVADRRAGDAGAVTAKLGEILVVAQIYDPKLLIAEFTAPATISDRGSQPSMMVNWSKARSSVVGLPGVPQRASLVFDDPAIDRVNGSVQTPLARAKHVELHGRLAEGSPSDHPVIETVLQIDRRQRAGACIRCWPSRSMPTCGRCSAA